MSHWVLRAIKPLLGKRTYSTLTFQPCTRVQKGCFQPNRFSSQKVVRARMLEGHSRNRATCRGLRREVISSHDIENEPDDTSGADAPEPPKQPHHRVEVNERKRGKVYRWPESELEACTPAILVRSCSHATHSARMTLPLSPTAFI